MAGRIITMALESVDYSEEKACKILEIVMQDDKGTKEEIKQEIKGDASVENETAPTATTAIQPGSSVPDGVDHEERYEHFCSHFFPMQFPQNGQIPNCFCIASTKRFDANPQQVNMVLLSRFCANVFANN